MNLRKNVKRWLLHETDQGDSGVAILQNSKIDGFRKSVQELNALITENAKSRARSKSR